MQKINYKSYIAEFIGTCALVVFGCGAACIVPHSYRDAGYLIVALAFGLVIVAMAYSIGNISGCHVNPAVSLAMLINKKMTVTDFVGYVISQFLGATAGAGLLKYFLPEGTHLQNGLGSNEVYENDVLKSIIIEVLLTFIFVIAILGVTSKVKNAQVAGLVIGLTLTLVHIFGIYFTGTSVNPARSFGPAIVSGGKFVKDLWVFIVSPLIGSAIAAFTWKAIGNKD